MHHKNDIDRFLPPQEAWHDKALAEIRRGHKESHYMWFIFPQLRGLGHSYYSDYYGISGLDETKAYLQHPILGPRLLEITTALLQLPGNDPYIIFGSIDTKKLCACMTLFEKAGDNSVFSDVLRKYYTGRRHTKTLKLLGNSLQ